MHWWNELTPLVFSIGFVAGVIGNLVASALWAGPALTHLHRKLDRNHEAAQARHAALLSVLRERKD